MKSLTLAPLAALLCAAAAPAFAQSSVTIYGRLNETVENVKFGDGESLWVLNNNASRIGFKGTEDLGGGLKAGFQIEHGFAPDTGAASNAAFWSRQSEVNLGSSTFGTVRLGRFTSDAYYATADYVSLHNHDTGTSEDKLYAYVSGDANKVSYHSPTFGGASFDIARTLGEGTGPVTYDLAVNWANGPLQLGAGYAKDKTADKQQFAVRALYQFGAFTVGGYIQRDEDVFAVGKRTNVRLSGMYTMGATELHVNVGKAGDTGDVANTGATQATLGVNYNLSKRTKVYAYYTRLNDDTAGLYNGDFRSGAVGIRHNF